MQRKTIKVILSVVAPVVTAAVIYFTWRWLGWYIAPETPTDRKDHVQVLAVGLGAIGAIITAIIGWRNLRQSQRSTEITIENTRLIEEERAQNDALQTYIDQMGTLLIKENLRSSEEDADLRRVARAQTLTVLQGLGPDRKRILLRFLYESHLINEKGTIVDLVGADLLEANLREAYLRGAKLSGTDLSGADLTKANLSSANLKNIKGVTIEELEKQAKSVEGATLPDGSKHD